jgi:hypothetical protein
MSASGTKFAAQLAISLTLLLLLQSCHRVPPTGGPVSGSVYFQVKLKMGDTIGPDHQIALPDIEVFLHNTTSGVDSPVVTTDLFGRYRFPHQDPGTYELRWNAQRGWAAGKHPDAIEIKSGPRYPLPSRILTENPRGAIFGRVTLDDGRTPWSYDEIFAVDHTAAVTILDEAGTATLSGPVRANSEGQFAAAGVPRGLTTRVRVRSQAAESTRTIDASHIAIGTPAQATDVQLADKPPEIITVVPTMAGTLVRTAAPGDTLNLAAVVRDLNGDSLQYAWATLSGHGSITPAGAGSAAWTLPNVVGLYSAYLQVGDGRGGFARQRIDFTTGRTHTTFSGIVVEKGSGTRLKGAEVLANGQTSVTDTNGFFSVNVPLNGRYVLNISRAGYALFSRVVDSGLTGQTWALVKAQSQSVDPTGPIDLTDTRPELERNKMRGTRIRIPANALVGPGGAAPTGALTAYLATLNIADGEAPGDWGAIAGSRETNLISYGATFVEFRDSSGQKYNLAPGAQAELEMFAPSGMAPGAPANIKLWSYAEADGFWKVSGSASFSSTNGSFKGKVSHFSTINADVEKDDDACLKVLIYPPISTGVKLRVTSSAFSQSFEFVLDAAINGVFRLPSQTDVQLQLFEADGSGYAGNVLLEEVPGEPLPGNVVNTGPAIPSGQGSFPPEPYETCKLVIMREANEPTANAFLAYKGQGDADKANGYYAAVDPNNERETLGEWWDKNGFTFDANGQPTNGVRTSYLNFNDLGSGRDMHFLKRADGTVAAYVTNYGQFNQDHGNADLAANRISPGATVAMEYGPVEGQGTTRVVKFFVFAGGDFARNAPRAPAADLDGFGAKFVPNLCLNCHGGDYSPQNKAAPTFAEINMGASFRELDIATYKFPGGRLDADSAEKTAFRQQNLVVKGAAAGDTITIQPIKELIDGWYPGSSIDQDNSYTPGGWSGAPQQDLYHDVIKNSCRTCHVALDPEPDELGLGWTSYDQLKFRYERLQGIVLCESRVMPHAVTTYRNFWLSAGPHRPAVLRNFADGGDWPAFGACQ